MAKMTYGSYILNPLGKDNAVFSARDMYKNLYTEKLDKILLRENGKIDYALYTLKDKYYIHMKIPSEVVKNFYYDTVVEFYTDDNALKMTRSLTDYYVRFYSNDPSFVFTFTHAFIKNDMFIKELESKMSKQAVKKRAVEKNPNELVGYVKSIYFMYLIIMNKGLMKKALFDSYATKLVWKDLISKIVHADAKIQARQEAQEKINADKKKQKDAENRARANVINQTRTNNSKPNGIKITSKIGKVGSTKAVKTTKRIGRTKKI